MLARTGRRRFAIARLWRLWLTYEVRGRSARGNKLNDDKGSGLRDEFISSCNRCLRGERWGGDAVEDLSCRAHPGTEHGAVRGFLMVRMLGFMSERLCGGHTADHDETDDQEAGEGTLEEPVRHIVHSSRTAMRSYWSVSA